jgi:hypothetical protein
MIAHRLSEAEVREGNIYDLEGRSDSFLSETLASTGYYIIELAHRHRDEFACKVVSSISHLKRIMTEITTRSESMDDWLTRVRTECQRLLHSPDGSHSDDRDESDDRDDSHGSEGITLNLSQALNESQDDEGIAWVWKGQTKVKVGGNGEVPSLAEARRLIKELADGAKDLTIRDNLITSQDGEYDDLYNELYMSITECVMSMAVNHNHPFAQKLVEAFPHLSQFAHCLRTKSPNAIQTTSKGHLLVVSEVSKRSKKERLIVQDSGASRDIACTSKILRKVRETDPVSLITGNGECEITRMGVANLTRIDGNGKPVLVQKDMLLDTRVPANIVSTGNMDYVHHRAIVHQNGQMVILKYPIPIRERDILVRGRLTSGMLYRWDDEYDKPLNVNSRYDPKTTKRGEVKTKVDKKG